MVRKISNSSKLKFIRFLQNVDDSITNLKLKHNLHVNYFTESETYDFFKRINNWDKFQTFRNLALDGGFNYETKKAYFIETEIEGDNSEGIILMNDVARFQHNVIIPYLEPLLTALRLFKRGDIAYWNTYFSMPTGGRIWFGSSLRVWGREIYSLAPEEIESCNQFINNFRMPEQAFLALAIDQFNNSYILPKLDAQLLSLMISLEALFSKGPQELSFRVARNCAIFLSENYKKGKEIFRNMKGIYDKRSKLIHGKKVSVTQEDVGQLQGYARKAVRKYLSIKKNHNDVLGELDTLGFGQFTI